MQPSPTARTTEAWPAPLDVGSPLGAVPHVGSQRVADSSGWRGPRSPLPAVQLQAGLVKATGVDLVWDGPSGHGGPGASTPQSCRTHRFVALVEGVGEQHPTRGLGRPLCCAAHGTAGTGLHCVTAGELRQGGIRSETSHCCRAVLGVGTQPQGSPTGCWDGPHLSPVCALPGPIPQGRHPGSSRSSQSWQPRGQRPLQPAGSHLWAKWGRGHGTCPQHSHPVFPITQHWCCDTRGVTSRVVIVGATEPLCAAPQLRADRHIDRPAPIQPQAHTQPAVHSHKVPEPGDTDPCRDATRALSRAQR